MKELDRIHVLDDNTIDKIAAGEVVERPASIIKELVENSIDAGSNSITIEIKDGGRSHIRVTDNGRGMSPEDARVSFQRHATSKIHASRDLENILTLGFRGEALASIAAVTRLEMITRERDTLSGVQIINQGGQLVTEKEIGCPEGTTIIAEDLFFNTPARLKFLKSPRTETAYISDLVGRFILAHPHISFRYINNGKIVYYSPGDGDLRNAILSIYGKDTVDQILPIEPRDNSMDMELSGYLGKPSLARKNRSHQSFFVNGRYVKSSLIEESIEAAYRPYLTVNLFPWIVLNIHISPSKIDVNVHPAKTEIRFRDGEAIGSIIREHIEGILEENPYIPSLKKESFLFPSLVDKDKKEEDGEQMEAFSSISSTSFTISSPDNENDENGMQAEDNDFAPRYLPIKEEASKVYVASHPEEGYNQSMNSYGDENNKAVDISPTLKVVGKIFATYIILEGEDECFLIDQHAAHERLIFERYKEMVSKQAVATQQLLPPVVMEVTHKEQLVISDSMELFDSLGFEIEPFGGRSFAIRGVPLILGSSNTKEFFQELLDRTGEFAQGSNYRLKIDEIIQMSCKNAVKAGDSLSDIEIIALINDLRRGKIPMTCPHGRPIMISISRNELEKMFKRIQ